MRRGFFFTGGPWPPAASLARTAPPAALRAGSPSASWASPYDVKRRKRRNASWVFFYRGALAPRGFARANRSPRRASRGLAFGELGFALRREAPQTTECVVGFFLQGGLGPPRLRSREPLPPPRFARARLRRAGL